MLEALAPLTSNGVIVVVDTGHFQNFRWNHLGHMTLSDVGDFELEWAE